VRLKGGRTETLKREGKASQPGDLGKPKQEKKKKKTGGPIRKKRPGPQKKRVPKGPQRGNKCPRQKTDLRQKGALTVCQTRAQMNNLCKGRNNRGSNTIQKKKKSNSPAKDGKTRGKGRPVVGGGGNRKRSLK